MNARDTLGQKKALDIQNTLSGESSRRVLWDIYKFCRAYLANDGADPYHVGINEGQRRVGLFIEELLTVVPSERIGNWKDEMFRLDEVELEELENAGRTDTNTNSSY